MRDEVKRLRATELAVIDDPTAKHLPSPGGGAARDARRGGANALRAASPLGEEGGRESRRNGPRKPALDEMGPGPESAPYRGPRSTLGKPGMRGGFKPKRRH
jgi:excinuclease ABC subunit B